MWIIAHDFVKRGGYHHRPGHNIMFSCPVFLIIMRRSGGTNRMLQEKLLVKEVVVIDNSEMSPYRRTARAESSLKMQLLYAWQVNANEGLKGCRWDSREFPVSSQAISIGLIQHCIHSFIRQRILRKLWPGCVLACYSRA